MNKFTFLLLTLISACLLSTSALAKKHENPGNNPTFDQDVTSAGIYFGSGNGNGYFTVIQNNGVELGLRIKSRFPKNGTYNSNHDGTYTFPAGYPDPGFSWDQAWQYPATPVWNFEWSVNTDYDGSTEANLSDYVYELGLDADPGKGTDFTVFDPITPSIAVPFYDHGIGDNSGPAPDSENPAYYVENINNYNVAQNSWNYSFFNNPGTSLEFFDPSVPGVYVIYLRAKSKVSNAVVASVSIHVIVVE